MDRFAALTGRSYRLFDYDGAPDAERVIVMMGSGARDGRARRSTCAGRRAASKVGVLQVRLYRPFSAEHFLAALPATVRSDRGARPDQGAGRAPASRCTRTWSRRWPRRSPTAPRGRIRA